MVPDIFGLFGEFLDSSHYNVIVHGVHVDHLALAVRLDALQQHSDLTIAMLHSQSTGYITVHLLHADLVVLDK